MVMMVWSKSRPYWRCSRRLGHWARWASQGYGFWQPSTKGCEVLAPRIQWRHHVRVASSWVHRVCCQYEHAIWDGLEVRWPCMDCDKNKQHPKWTQPHLWCATFVGHLVCGNSSCAYLKSQNLPDMTLWVGITKNPSRSGSGDLQKNWPLLGSIVWPCLNVSVSVET